jgi:hypothetical protein
MRVLSLTVMLASAAAVFAQDLVDVQWGASPNQVMAPGEAWTSWADTLYGHIYRWEVYWDVVMDLQASVSYFFIDESLKAVSYSFEMSNYQEVRVQDERIPSGYFYSGVMTSYDDVLNRLTDVYGQPYVNRVRWIDDQYAGVPEQWDLALRLGHVSCTAGWETVDAIVTISLFSTYYNLIFTCELRNPGFLGELQH